VGYDAGVYNQTGSANSVFGYAAGGFGAAAVNSFSSSTIMGSEAGYMLTTGSADNIFLGWRAGYSVTSGTGNIIIGYNKDAPTPTTNNFLNIGGVIYGDLSTGYVGIGTAAPSAMLDVNGTVKLSRYLVESRDGGGNLTTSDFGKTLTVNSGVAETLFLPAVAATDIGAQFTIVKLGTGQVTIIAAAGTYIADSGVGGTIYNDSTLESYACITLRLASATKWVITGGDGNWMTTN